MAYDDFHFKSIGSLLVEIDEYGVKADEGKLIQSALYFHVAYSLFSCRWLMGVQSHISIIRSVHSAICSSVGPLVHQSHI